MTTPHLLYFAVLVLALVIPCVSDTYDVEKVAKNIESEVLQEKEVASKNDAVQTPDTDEDTQDERIQVFFLSHYDGILELLWIPPHEEGGGLIAEETTIVESWRKGEKIEQHVGMNHVFEV